MGTLSRGLCCDNDDASDVTASDSGSVTIIGPDAYTPASANGLFLESVSAFSFGGTTTVTDQFANTSQLRDGQSKFWQSAEDGLPLNPPTFTVPAGVQLDVIWTEPAI